MTAISPEAEDIPTPDTWQIESSSQASLTTNWLQQLGDKKLQQFVKQALEKNFQLAAQKARVEESRAGLMISRADRLPDVSLQFDAARRRSVTNADLTSTASHFDFGVDVSLQVDIWGQLSDAQQQSLLLFKANEAEYLSARLTLAINVARAWYNMTTAQQLVSLFEKRLQNLELDADIINSGYQQGINAALDVYQNNATLEQERARLLQQRQILLENTMTLENLLAEYPSASIVAATRLPDLDLTIPVGLPSALLTRRPDLQRAWLELLASDKALAVAHKARFPRLSLLASTSDVSSELGNLLNGPSLAWSLLASISQPLFNAGRIQALEEQARSRVIQAEKRYLDAVYRAFAEVESALTRDRSLQQRYAATVLQEKNAENARLLSFEQYQGGLVSYTTVLAAQLRAFDAQSALIELRHQQIQTRIELYLALGGEFKLPP